MSAIRPEIRPSDCDSFGHVNNAVYVSYFEQALAECLVSHGYKSDWQYEGECEWQPQSLILEYRRPVAYGDDLEGRLWLAKPHASHPTFGFEIRAGPTASEDDAAPVAFRAAGVWTRRKRKGGEPKEIPVQLLRELPQAPGIMPRDWHPPSPSSEVRDYHWDHRVELSEVGPTRNVHPEALYQWFEESVFDASAQAGWPLESWLATGFFTLQTRHDTDIFSLPVLGDTVRITSRLVEARRLGGTWLLQVERVGDGQLLVTDYSTGVHLNLEGRPASPPPQIIEDIQSKQTPR